MIALANKAAIIRKHSRNNRIWTRF